MLHASTILLHSSSRFFTKASLKLLLARMTIIGLLLLSEPLVIKVSVYLSIPYIYDQELLYLRIGRDKSIFRRTGHLLDASITINMCYCRKNPCHNFVTSTVPDSDPKTIVLVAFILIFYKT